MKAPTGTVECRDQALCGAKFHYSHTIAACGATKNTMRNAPLLNTAPKSTKADPNCPKHGIEPEGEYEVAALNRQQVAAGIVGATAIFGLCSCSATPSPDPSGSGSPTVEQTVSPTTQPSGSATVEASPDSEVVSQDPLKVPDESAFPALDAADYEFSDTPQSAGEQWIADNYPDLWDQGIRATTGETWQGGYTWQDPDTPGALVQYIKGKRYEGIPEMPLGFRGQLDDPESMPTDTLETMRELIKDPSVTEDKFGAIGKGGYVVSILENPLSERGILGSGVNESNDTELYISNADRGTEEAMGGEIRRFGDWEEAWAYLQENGFTPNAEGARKLYPGEIANVGVRIEDGPNSSTYTLYNPTTDEFEVVREIG